MAQVGTAESAVVRAATVDDAEELARVHVAAWQAAYAGLMPAPYLDRLDPSSKAEGWRRLLSGVTPPDVLVALLGPVPVGFASVGADRDGGPHGELFAINLHPDVWGRGVGTALLARAQGRLAEAGFTRAVLWVLPGNLRARRFYASRGWSDDGVARQVELAGLAVDEVRYSTPLAPRTALPGGGSQPS